MPLQIPILACTVGRYCLVGEATSVSALTRTGLRGHTEGTGLYLQQKGWRSLPCGLAQLAPALLEDLC